MTPHETTGDSPLDDALVDELAAIDESPARAHDSLSEELQELAECLRLIDRVRHETPELLADITGSGRDTSPWLDGGTDCPAQIGRFQIKRKLGQGGFGLVFLAHDPELERDVALKVPRVEALVSAQTRDRFLREGKSSASLNHPNIATVFEAGQIGPICYIASHYCAGGTLAEFLSAMSPSALRSWREKVLTTEQALTQDAPSPGDTSCQGTRRSRSDRRLSAQSAAVLIATLADAVEHGHSRGVLHRDLKPTNIMFDTPDLSFLRDDDALAATARIVDFGLAKSLDTADNPTKTGAMLGTPAYMSPEQASGKKKGVGRASDVYSLGAILYELLTARPPHVGESDVETILLVKDEEPTPPRRLAREIPRDLEVICLKCLAKDPARRYPTARLLADDLGRFRRGEPILARPTLTAVQVRRWCRRHPFATSFAVLVLLLAVLGPIVAINQSRLYRDAQTAREETRHMLYISDMNLALQDWEAANLAHVGELLARHRPLPAQDDPRGFEWYYLSRLYEQSRATPALRHESGSHCLAMSRDGLLLAVGLADGNIVLWDVRRRIRTKVLSGHGRAPVVAVCFSPDASQLTSASHDRTVRVWDVASGSEVDRLDASQFAALSPDGTNVAYLAAKNEIGIWNLTTGDRTTFSDRHADHVRDLAFSPNGKTLASASWDHTIKLWDVQSGHEKKTLRGHEARVWCVAFSPNGHVIASGDVNRMIKLWDVETAAELKSLSGHRGTVLAANFSANGEQLASSSSDNTLKLWDVRSGRELQTLRAHAAEVWDVAFSSKRSELYSAGDDGIVRIWALEGQTTNDMLSHPSAVSSVCFSPDGTMLSTTCWDGVIRLWNPATGKKIHEFAAHDAGHAESEFVISEGAVHLASISGAGSLKLWNASNWKLARLLPIQSVPDANTSISSTSETHLIAWPQTDTLVRLFDLSKGEISHDYPSLESPRDLVFSFDGTLLAIAHGPYVDIWNTQRHERVGRLVADHTRVEAVMFSPNGTSLATGGVDRILRMWDVAEVLSTGGKNVVPLQELIGHGGLITAVAYSRDGRTLASAGGDQAIRLWDQHTSLQRGALKGHMDSISSLTFSPDGRTLASASADNTVRIWRAVAE